MHTPPIHSHHTRTFSKTHVQLAASIAPYISTVAVDCGDYEEDCSRLGLATTHLRLYTARQGVGVSVYPPTGKRWDVMYNLPELTEAVLSALPRLDLMSVEGYLTALAGR